MTKYKSVRLGNWEKKEIVSAIIDKSSHTKKAEKLKERESVLAVKLRNHTLGKHKETYFKLPDSLQKRGGHIAVRGSDVYEYLYFDRELPRPVSVVVIDSLPSRLKTSTEKFIKDKAKLKKDAKEFRKLVESIIESCNSTKKLESTFPGVREFYPVVLINETKGVNLPAIPVSQIAEIKAQIE